MNMFQHIRKHTMYSGSQYTAMVKNMHFVTAFILSGLGIGMTGWTTVYKGVRRALLGKKLNQLYLVCVSAKCVPPPPLVMLKERS